LLQANGKTCTMLAKELAAAPVGQPSTTAAVR
jgi:hypothetical protein